MSQNKTVANEKNVDAFINAVEPERKRKDSLIIKDLMEEVTGEPAAMWGTSIVGFGSHHYKYESGRKGDMPLVGFSPRKQAITLYIMSGLEPLITSATFYSNSSAEDNYVKVKDFTFGSLGTTDASIKSSAYPNSIFAYLLHLRAGDSTQSRTKS